MIILIQNRNTTAAAAVLDEATEASSQNHHHFSKNKNKNVKSPLSSSLPLNTIYTSIQSKSEKFIFFLRREREEYKIYDGIIINHHSSDFNSHTTTTYSSSSHNKTTLVRLFICPYIHTSYISAHVHIFFMLIQSPHISDAK
jgi:hypothetical protein